MITVKNEGNVIEYTKEDSFELPVEADEADNNTRLRLVIAVDEVSTPIIDKQFSYDGGEFILTLNSAEKAMLNIGNYIFKMSLINGLGEIVTCLSGDFIVKWGV